MVSDYILSKQKAFQQYDAAFHLLKVTFPLVKDQKLLIGIIHNLFASMELCMDAILRYERELQLIPIYSEQFEAKYRLFLSRSVRRNNIPLELVLLMKELKEILDLHRHSPLEFQRGNRFVISTKDYQLKSISIKEISAYLQQAKQFLEVTDKVVRFQ